MAQASQERSNHEPMASKNQIVQEWTYCICEKTSCCTWLLDSRAKDGLDFFFHRERDAQVRARDFIREGWPVNVPLLLDLIQWGRKAKIRFFFK